jgi:hypothetical protein
LRAASGNQPGHSNVIKWSGAASIGRIVQATGSQVRDLEFGSATTPWSHVRLVRARSMSKTLNPFRLMPSTECPCEWLSGGSRLVAVAGSSGGEGSREHYRILRASGGCPRFMGRVIGTTRLPTPRARLLRSSANSLCCNAVQPGLIWLPLTKSYFGSWLGG